MRLDGPDDDHGAPRLAVTTADLEAAVTDAAARVRLVVDASTDQQVRLRFGDQVDTRPIETAGDDALTAEAVAAYIAKYATKAAEDFGIGDRPLDPRAATRAGATPHIVAMIAAAERLADSGVDELVRLHRWTHMLGFRGHFSTKSRRYSTTLGALRQARREYRRQTALDVRDIPDDTEDDDTTLVVGHWTFAGLGYTTTGDAVLAAASAARAREWRELARVAVN